MYIQTYTYTYASTYSVRRTYAYVCIDRYTLDTHMYFVSKNVFFFLYYVYYSMFALIDFGP